MADQQTSLSRWVRQQLNNQDVTLQPLYGDASRRRYFRASAANNTTIAVDASVELTDLPAFIAIDSALAELGLHVPEILAIEPLKGYLLLSDLGGVSLLSAISYKNADKWYQLAIKDLLCLQGLSPHNINDFLMPHYDHTLITREWTIFTHWFLGRYKKVDLQQHHEMLDSCFLTLKQTMIEQPQVFIHRDYHSRNLMVQDDEHLAIIDFQGARIGPISYDVASLLKDCYIDWPAEQVEQWALQFQQQAWSQHDLAPVSKEQFLRWFHVTGLQRHLKVLGQFSRKALAEGNSDYLPDMPRVLQYVLSTCRQYPEFHALADLIEDGQ